MSDPNEQGAAGGDNPGGMPPRTTARNTVVTTQAPANTQGTIVRTAVQTRPVQIDPLTTRVTEAVSQHYAQGNGPPNYRISAGEDRRPQVEPHMPPFNQAIDPEPIDLASKEGKYSILDEATNGATYSPSQEEICFMKNRWSYDGKENFEDYILKIGGFARTLKVSDICFKNTLYQSFRAPCSYMVSDMEPSLQPYLMMNKRDYVKAIHERLEPASAADLIYTQYKERSQKVSEVYDLYLRDKHNLFIRSFPNGKERIFKDFIEESIRGLQNELLRTKIRDFISIQHLNGNRIETFDALRRIVQISVENLQSKAIAGELDATDVAGTDIRMMSYSYVDNKEKSRFEVNALNEDANEEIDEINEFRNFQKFQKYNNFKRDNNKTFTPRTATEKDICYSCNSPGHFSRNCPRKTLPGKVNKVDAEDQKGDDNLSTDTSEDENDLEIDYINRRNYQNKPRNGKFQKRKPQRRIHEIVEEQGNQIASLTSQFSELIAVIKNQNTNKINAITEDEINLPRELASLDNEPEDDFYSFL
jgi:hypothetical protein